MIDIAIVDDHRMFVEALRAWMHEVDDIRLLASAPSVGQFLRAGVSPLDVVLLDSALRTEPDPALNVRRLIEAGHRVLVVDSSTIPGPVAPVLAAGAHGYLTRYHDLPGLAVTLRAIAIGGTAWTLGPTATPVPSCSRRPLLSEKEFQVLMAYASGLTLDSTARRLGIRPSTAHTYLTRVKAKYRRIGIQVATKLELAQQVRAECAGGLITSEVPG